LPCKNPTADGSQYSISKHLVVACKKWFHLHRHKMMHCTFYPKGSQPTLSQKALEYMSKEVKIVFNTILSVSLAIFQLLVACGNFQVTIFFTR